MHCQILNLLVCPSCRGEHLTVKKFRTEIDDVIDGAVICDLCNTWWRIENGILDFLSPALRNKEKYKAFALRHGLELENDGDKSLTDEASLISLQEQIHFFAEDSQHYERDVTSSPYFTALDEVVFKPWVASNIIKEGLVLEIGVGTGRQCARIAGNGSRVVGFDISEEMLGVARTVAIDRGVEGLIDLVIADAGDLPCRCQIFDAAIAVGTLHHVPDPSAVIHWVGYSLKAGAPVFTYDPHNSPVRFIFDIMMRWWKLYEEQASNDPLLESKDIHFWMNNAFISGKTRISTYLPPHFFHLLPNNWNRILLGATDFLFGSIPILKKCGGMIIFDGRKLGERNQQDKLLGNSGI